MKNLITLTVLLLFMFLCTSCVHLLPSNYEEDKALWTDYGAASSAFSSIVHGTTRLSEIQTTGFDIFNGANIKTLNFLDVQEMFLSHPSLELEDLPKGVRDCLEAQDHCDAYLLSVERLKSERYGSFWADLFGFRKKTHHTGWKYEVLLVVIDDIVVYALESGIPNIDRREVEKNPLGPLDGFGEEALEKAGKSIF